MYEQGINPIYKINHIHKHACTVASEDNVAQRLVQNLDSEFGTPQMITSYDSAFAQLSLLPSTHTKVGFSLK